MTTLDRPTAPPVRQRADPALRALYARLYGRSDLRGSTVGLRLLRRPSRPCGSCAGCSTSASLTLRGAPPRDRALIAFGYGPAFVPLGLTHPRSTITSCRQAPPGARRGAARGRRRPAAVRAAVPARRRAEARTVPAGSARRASTRRNRAVCHSAQVRKQLRLDGPGLPLALVEGDGDRHSLRRRPGHVP